MSTQAMNSIELYRGNAASKILQLLNFQRQSVVDELLQHFHASSKEALANILSNL